MKDDTRSNRRKLSQIPAQQEAASFWASFEEATEKTQIHHRRFVDQNECFIVELSIVIGDFLSGLDKLLTKFQLS